MPSYAAKRLSLPTYARPASAMFAVLTNCMAIAMASSSAALLNGCATKPAGVTNTAPQIIRAEVQGKFVYKGRIYNRREEAETAYKQNLSALLNQIEPLRDPLPLAAQIIIPSKDAVVERQRTLGGAEANDYRATLLSDHLRAYATAIRVRNLFSALDIVETSLPDHVAAKPTAALIYFYLSPAGEWSSWYYASEAVPRTPIIDQGSPVGITEGWVNMFLLAVEHVARKDKIK